MEINISKILQEVHILLENGVANGFGDYNDRQGWRSDIEDIIKEKCLQLIDSIPYEEKRYVEHMKSKRAFDEGNGYNDHCREVSSIIKELKK